MNPPLKTTDVGRMSVALSAVCIMPRTFFIRRIALHSHSAKSPKYGDISRWLTACGLIRPTALLFLGLIATPPANAEQLDRLFFTPAQRAQLDHNYAREARSDNNNDRALTLNGIVQMHGGKRTAWINGVPQTVGLSDERSPESVPVPLPGQNKSVKLKVGQRVLLSPSANTGTAKPDSPKQDTPKQ